MKLSEKRQVVAIACGGTGGHLFPGVAVADKLIGHGLHPMLLISQKEIDQFACKSAPHLEAVSLAGAGWTSGSRWKSLMGTWKGFRSARELFVARGVGAVLAMGGFTSVAPSLAARSLKLPVVLHEANAVPGRAARWLAPFSQCILTGFSEAAGLFVHEDVRNVGMPVRKELAGLGGDRRIFREKLGLQPDSPVLLVMGGSQGARAINDLLLKVLSELSVAWPELQIIHLTGPSDYGRCQEAARVGGNQRLVLPFATDMETILGACDFVISRSGASSLAEFAACRLPCILIPYPQAVDDHQRRNAEALVKAGGASLLHQAEATPELLLREVLKLRQPDQLEKRRIGMDAWKGGDAATAVADVVLEFLSKRACSVVESSAVQDGTEGGLKMEEGRAS